MSTASFTPELNMEQSYEDPTLLRRRRTMSVISDAAKTSLFLGEGRPSPQLQSLVSRSSSETQSLLAQAFEAIEFTQDSTMYPGISTYMDSYSMPPNSCIQNSQSNLINTRKHSKTTIELTPNSSDCQKSVKNDSCICKRPIAKVEQEEIELRPRRTNLGLVKRLLNKDDVDNVVERETPVSVCHCNPDDQYADEAIVDYSYSKSANLTSPDKGLENWNQLLAERQNITKKIVQHTGKRSGDVLFNRITTIDARDKHMVKRLIQTADESAPSYKRKPVIMKEPHCDPCNATRRQQCCVNSDYGQYNGCYSFNPDNRRQKCSWHVGLMETLPKREHGKSSNVEIIGLPTVTQRELLGEQKCSPLSPWIDSSTVQKQLGANRKNIKRVLKYFPDIDNLQVVGKQATLHPPESRSNEVEEEESVVMVEQCGCQEMSGEDEHCLVESMRVVFQDRENWDSLPKQSDSNQHLKSVLFIPDKSADNSSNEATENNEENETKQLPAESSSDTLQQAEQLLRDSYTMNRTEVSSAGPARGHATNIINNFRFELYSSPESVSAIERTRNASEMLKVKFADIEGLLQQSNDASLQLSKQEENDLMMENADKPIKWIIANIANIDVDDVISIDDNLAAIVTARKVANKGNKGSKDASSQKKHKTLKVKKGEKSGKKTNLVEKSRRTAKSSKTSVAPLYSYEVKSTLLVENSRQTAKLSKTSIVPANSCEVMTTNVVEISKKAAKPSKTSIATANSYEVMSTNVVEKSRKTAKPSNTSITPANSFEVSCATSKKKEESNLKAKSEPKASSKLKGNIIKSKLERILKGESRLKLENLLKETKAKVDTGLRRKSKPQAENKLQGECSLNRTVSTSLKPVNTAVNNQHPPLNGQEKPVSTKKTNLRKTESNFVTAFKKSMSALPSEVLSTPKRENAQRNSSQNSQKIMNQTSRNDLQKIEQKNYPKQTLRKSLSISHSPAAGTQHSPNKANDVKVHNYALSININAIPRVLWHPELLRNGQRLSYQKQNMKHQSCHKSKSTIVKSSSMDKTHNSSVPRNRECSSVNREIRSQLHQPRKSDKNINTKKRVRFNNSVEYSK